MMFGYSVALVIAVINDCTDTTLYFALSSYICIEKFNDIKSTQKENPYAADEKNAISSNYL